MGDRANVQVTNERGEKVNLYTHWNGTALPKTVQRALIRGKGRWTDYSYLTRIIFSEMIQNEVLQETGYGISQEPPDGHDRVINVHVEYVNWGDEPKCTITLKGNKMKVQGFIELQNPHW